jgi:hypothetical protein
MTVSYRYFTGGPLLSPFLSPLGDLERDWHVTCAAHTHPQPPLNPDSARAGAATIGVVRFTVQAQSGLGGKLQYGTIFYWTGTEIPVQPTRFPRSPQQLVVAVG